MLSSKALLVGIANYESGSGLNCLCSPENDARALTAVLKEEASGFACESLLSATEGEMRRRLEKFFTASARDDVLLFYFSGHGKLGQNGGLYLCPRDIEAELIDSTAISLAWLNQVIDRCQARQIIVLLDCCYSGEASLSMKTDIASVIQSNVGKGRGKYLITSSTNYQVSLERPGDDNSLFTKWLIHGIRSGDADLNNDGVITVEELFQYAQQKVPSEYSNQTPQFWKWGTSPGDAIIRGRSRPQITSVTNEDAFYNAARDLFARRASIVPFLGPGVFGRGPLSSYQLSAAMSAQAGIKSSTIASSSEIAQHLKNIYARDPFASFYHQLISSQNSLAPSCASYALVEQSIVSTETTLIVSLTHDFGLENALIARGKRLCILAHVLGSDEPNEVGRLLQISIDKGTSHQFSLSDEWLLPRPLPEVVVYKILGSTFLSELVGRCDIDTLVATEEDFGCLFGFFENGHRRPPSALTLWLQKRPSVFLGFGLDVWEYRLLTFLLEQVVGQNALRRGRRYAVREPTSPIETLSWQRLGMDLIRMEPEEFAKSLLLEQGR